MNQRLTGSGRQAAALALTAALALGLAACGRSDSSGSSMGSTEQLAPAASAAARDQSMDTMASGADAKAGASVDTVAAGAPMLVKRADTAIVVKDVRAAAAEIRGIATTAGGNVLNESIQSTDADVSVATWATMTIQVPADKLDDALARLDKLGDVASRDTSAEDVKAQYVDVEARVAAMQISVDRIRTLLGQATKIEDIITIESELSRRQADLDALQAQLKSLKDQVAMSPISIRLTTDRIDLGADGGGFLGGLKAGWTAFLTSIRFLFTALGAVLPFAVFIGLIAAPLILWVRKRNRIHRPQGPGGPSAHAMVPAQPLPPTQPLAASAVAATPSAPSTPAAQAPDDGQP